MHANGKRENGKPGVVVSSVERISLRIAIAPGHFCALASRLLVVDNMEMMFGDF